MLHASGLVKRFGDQTAVAGVDLRVGPGRIHGLLGPNGAGKTTVLSMLFGLTRPDEGRIELDGQPVAAYGRGLPRTLSGFVDSPRFYPYLSARDTLRLLADYDGLPAARVDDVLATVELTDRADAKVGGFSLGMRQRLGLAAALLRRPRMLILDEPTNGLDPAGLRDVSALLRQLRADGVGVLLSSHGIARVESLCDSVTIMRSGGVVFAGTLDELRARAPAPEFVLHTSDDAAAVSLARPEAGVDVEPDGDGGLRLRASPAAADAFLIALARRGVAVRGLRVRSSSLERMFFRLTGGVPDGRTIGTTADRTPELVT